MTSSDLAKVNMRQGAPDLPSILVSWQAFCLDSCSKVCGYYINGRARRLTQVFTVDDRPCVCSLLFRTFRTCTCVPGPDFERCEAPGK